MNKLSRRVFSGLAACAAAVVAPTGEFMTRQSLAVAVLTLIACGSGSSGAGGGGGFAGGSGGGGGGGATPDAGAMLSGGGKGSVSGSLGFQVGSARTFLTGTSPADGGLAAFSRIEINLTNRDQNVCARTPPTPANYVVMYVAKSTTETAQGLGLGPGSYAIAGGFGSPNGFVSLLRADYNGPIQVLGAAVAGSITLTSVNATGVVGSYDVTFADGGLSGTFEAPSCP